MEKTIEIDLREVFSALLRRIWLIILSAVLAGSLVLGYTVMFVTPQYKATVSMYVNNKSNTSGNTSISSSDLSVALRLVTTYVNIIKSDAVLEKVAQEVAQETQKLYTAAQLRGMLSAASVDETEMFEFSISHPDPLMAQTIANAIARIAPGEIATIIEGSSAKIIDLAKVPSTYYTPSYPRNALLGAAVGMFLAAAVVVLQVILDGRIKSEDDLAKICNAPVLGSIPDFLAENNSSYYRYDTSTRKPNGK